MALNNLLSFSSLLFFLCCLNGADDVHGARHPNQPYHVVPVKSLLPQSNCIPSSTRGSTRGSQKLKLTYSYGPCSPLGHKNKTPNSDTVLSQDKARVQSINGLRGASNLYPAQDSQTKLAVAAGIFTVTIGLGTPKQDYSVLVDTGSDLTWIQCKPCSTTTSCYLQDQPIFDPSQSSSYSNGSCKSANLDNSYSSTYKDGSYSRGFYGCDTLTYENTNVFPNFQFGCGHDNSGSFDGAAGMLGLGQGDLSFVSQTASTFGKYFSYCIPSNPSHSGYLLFGNQAMASSSSRVFTPLLRYPKNPSLYFVSLIGITIGSSKMKMSASTSSSSGTIIDSGTSITRLPESVYSILKSGFQETMSQYPSATQDPNEKVLDTCYDLTGYPNVMLPYVVLHFDGGADVNLHESGILWAKGDNQFCFAFAAKEKDDDVNIIGNAQQKAMDVLYDLERGRIGFGTNACSY